jgi:hypothetical protein
MHGKDFPHSMLHPVRRSGTDQTTYVVVVVAAVVVLMLRRFLN